MCCVCFWKKWSGRTAFDFPFWKRISYHVAKIEWMEWMEALLEKLSIFWKQRHHQGNFITPLKYRVDLMWAYCADVLYVCMHMPVFFSTWLVCVLSSLTIFPIFILHCIITSYYYHHHSILTRLDGKHGVSREEEIPPHVSFLYFAKEAATFVWWTT